MAAMNIRMPDDLAARLRRCAEQDGRSANQEVITAVEEFLARRKHEQIVQLAKQVAEQDRDLLDRLGQS